MTRETPNLRLVGGGPVERCECSCPTPNEKGSSGFIECATCGLRLDTLRAFRCMRKHLRDVDDQNWRLEEALRKIYLKLRQVEADRDQYRERAMALDPDYASKDWGRA